eukprot:SAG31_NODE_3906_length_3765_cov_1.595745_3_plen_69_part_00
MDDTTPPRRPGEPALPGMVTERTAWRREQRADSLGVAGRFTVAERVHQAAPAENRESARARLRGYGKV